MSTLHTWALRWSIPLAAIQDLQRQLGAINTDPASNADGGSEAAVSVRVRLEASTKGARLWRNNVGAMYDERGQFIRFGLANDSKQLNAHVKSADLIGIRPVLVTPAHVGHTLGVFISREIKAADWRYSATARELAQLRWAELIVGLGGDACFATGEGTL